MFTSSSCVSAKHLEKMEFFLNADVETEKLEEYGIAPSHIGATLGYKKIVEFLVEKGVEVNVKMVIKGPRFLGMLGRAILPSRKQF